MRMRSFDIMAVHTTDKYRSKKLSCYREAGYPIVFMLIILKVLPSHVTSYVAQLV